MAYQTVSAPPLVGVTEGFEINLRATIEGTRTNQAEMIAEVVAGREGEASLAAKNVAQDASLASILSTIISARGSLADMNANITDKETRTTTNIININAIALALAALIAASGTQVSSADSVGSLVDKIKHVAPVAGSPDFIAGTGVNGSVPRLLEDVTQLRNSIALNEQGTQYGVNEILRGEDGITSEPAATNVCADSRNFEGVGWSGTATAVQDQVGFDGIANKAWTLTDDSSSTEYQAYATAVPDDSNIHTASICIAKEEDTTVFPAFKLSLTGGTNVDATALLNKSAGNANWQAPQEGVGSPIVKDLGDCWLLIISIKNNGTGNTLLTAYFQPAKSIDFATTSPTATGSAVFDQLDIRLNQSFMDSPIITEGTTLTRAATTETSVPMQTGSVAGAVELISGPATNSATHPFEVFTSTGDSMHGENSGGYGIAGWPITGAIGDWVDIAFTFSSTGTLPLMSERVSIDVGGPYLPAIAQGLNTYRYRLTIINPTISFRSDTGEIVGFDITNFSVKKVTYTSTGLFEALNGKVADDAVEYTLGAPENGGAGAALYETVDVVDGVTSLTNTGNGTYGFPHNANIGDYIEISLNADITSKTDISVYEYNGVYSANALISSDVESGVMRYRHKVVYADGIITLTSSGDSDFSFSDFKIKPVSPIRTAISCDWTPVADTQNALVKILSLYTGTTMLHIKSTNLLAASDGVVSPTLPLSYIANTTYSLKVIAGIASDMFNTEGTGPATGLTAGDKYFQIGYSSDAGATWTYSVPSAFVGRFAVDGYPWDNDAKLHLPYATPPIPTAIENVAVDVIGGSSIQVIADDILDPAIYETLTSGSDYIHAANTSGAGVYSFNTAVPVGTAVELSFMYAGTGEKPNVSESDEYGNVIAASQGLSVGSNAFIFTTTSANPSLTFWNDNASAFDITYAKLRQVQNLISVLNIGGNEVLEITGPGTLYLVDGYLKITDMVLNQEANVTLTGSLLGAGKFKASVYEEITPNLLTLKTHLYQISEVTTSSFTIKSLSSGTNTVHIYIST